MPDDQGKRGDSEDGEQKPEETSEDEFDWSEFDRELEEDDFDWGDTELPEELEKLLLTEDEEDHLDSGDNPDPLDDMPASADRDDERAATTGLVSPDPEARPASEDPQPGEERVGADDAELRTPTTGGNGSGLETDDYLGDRGGRATDDTESVGAGIGAAGSRRPDGRGRESRRKGGARGAQGRRDRAPASPGKATPSNSGTTQATAPASEREPSRARGVSRGPWLWALGSGSVPVCIAAYLLDVRGFLVGLPAIWCSIVMFAYGFLFLRGIEGDYSEARGDSFYYLGLMFTFVSLLVALVSFGSLQGVGFDLGPIIQSFGVALITTFVPVPVFWTSGRPKHQATLRLSFLRARVGVM